MAGCVLKNRFSDFQITEKVSRDLIYDHSRTGYNKDKDNCKEQYQTATHRMSITGATGPRIVCQF